MPPYTGPLWSSLKPEGGNSCWWGDRGRVMASFLKRISAEKCNRITETHCAESCWIWRTPNFMFFFSEGFSFWDPFFRFVKFQGSRRKKIRPLKDPNSGKCCSTLERPSITFESPFFVKFFGPNSKKSRDSLGFYTGIWFFLLDFRGPWKSNEPMAETWPHHGIEAWCGDMLMEPENSQLRCETTKPNWFAGFLFVGSRLQNAHAFLCIFSLYLEIPSCKPKYTIIYHQHLREDLKKHQFADFDLTWIFSRSLDF